MSYATRVLRAQMEAIKAARHKCERKGRPIDVRLSEWVMQLSSYELKERELAEAIETLERVGK